MRGFDENVTVAQGLEDTLLREGLGGGVEAECGQFVFGGIHGCAGRESQCVLWKIRFRDTRWHVCVDRYTGITAS